MTDFRKGLLVATLAWGVIGWLGVSEINDDWEDTVDDINADWGEALDDVTDRCVDALDDVGETLEGIGR